MRSLAIHKKQKSPAKRRGTGWLFESFQVEVHQSGFFSGICVGKQSETTLLIEPNGMSVCVQGDEPTSGTIAMCELIFDALQNGLTNALMCISLCNRQTSNLDGRIMGSLLGEWNTTIDTIPYRLVIFRKTNLVIE